MQYFGRENIPSLVRASTTSITLATTYLGQSTVVLVGGQAYSPSSTVTLSTGTSGLNGLDTGTLASNTLYYVYAVVSGGNLGMVMSVTGPATGPTGFASAYKYLGKCRTDTAATTISTDGQVAMSPVVRPEANWGTEWQSYTPTWTGFGSKTITLNSGKYRRVGSNIELMFAVNGNSTASGGGATTVSLSLPPGLTVNSTVTGTGDAGNFGAVQTYGITAAAVYDYTTQAINGTTSDTVRFVKVGSGTAYSAADLNVARSVQLEGLLSIPITEWSNLYT